MQTREQFYASRVYKLVGDYQTEQRKKLKETDTKKREEELKLLCKPYGSMAHKLPVLIRTAGLAQALAFVEARGNEDHEKLYNHLEEVLRESAALKSARRLSERSRTAEIEEYICLTEESLAALLWFKRYAQSVLGVEVTDESEESRDATIK